jgi:hypothetical protein
MVALPSDRASARSDVVGRIESEDLSVDST